MMPIALVACVLASLVTAQSAPADKGRDKLFGQTLTADGKPWPGATVRLLFRTVPERDDFGTTDVVEVQSDADGQFRAALLPCCAYTAYAQVAQPDGSIWFSAVAEGVQPGPHLRLRQEAEPRRPRAVQLIGVEAWAKVGVTLTLRTVAGTAVRQAPPVALDAEARGALPPQPGGNWQVEVLTSDGVPVVDQRISDQARVVPIPVVVPPPVRVRVTVRAETREGKALADATVWVPAMSGSRASPAGKTDAEGRCVVWLPAGGAGSQPGAVHVQRELQADAPGHAITSARLAEEPEGGAWDAQTQTRDVVLTARRGYAASGRLQGADGQPRGGVPLLLTYDGTIRETPNSSRGFTIWSRRVTTAPDGTFVLPSLDPDSPFQLLADAHTPGLFAADATFGLTPVAVLARGRNGQKGDRQLGDVGASATAPLRIEVHRVDGSPAQCAAIELTGSQRSVTTVALNPIRTDSRGRIALCLPAGPVPLLAYTTDGQVRFAALTSTAKAAPPAVITLEPAQRVRGRVVDSDGKPVAGATVRLMETHSRGGGDELSAEERTARSVYTHHGLRGQSDASGRFELWFLPVPGTTWGIVATTKRRDGRPCFSPISRFAQDVTDELELALPAPGQEGDVPGRKGG